MAEDKDKQSEEQVQPTSSWWGSWIDTAKTKSASVLEAVKKDLGELSEVVKIEASAASAVFDRSLGLSENDSTMGSMKKSFSSFLGSVTEALSPVLDDDDSETVMITNNDMVTLTGFKKHLAELQTNDATYLEEPGAGLVENYKRWLEVIEQDQFTEPRLAKQLSSSQILNDKYTNLVPEKVVHMEFWKRYLFKKALLEDALANAELAERRAKVEVQSTKTVSPKKHVIQTEQPKAVLVEECEPAEEDNEVEEADDDLEKPINWNVNDFSAANLELSEEEQARLLEEYEQEIKEREKGKAERADEAIADELLEIENKRNEKASAKVTNTTAQKNSNKNTVNSKISAKKENSKTKPEPKAALQNKQKQATQKTGKLQQPKAAPTTVSPPNSNKSSKKDGSLPIEKNHFTKDEVSSSTSDESWEKDFEVEEK